MLDEALQLKLKNAGLDVVNVSLSTLQDDEHARMFNVKGKLATVLHNLEKLSEIFPRKVKVNFMALAENVPQQLLPISDLSARLGITVSFLTTLENTADVSSRVLKYLTDNLGITSIQEKEGRFGKKTIYTLKNGGVWEFDDFREEKYRSLAFSNKECQKCVGRHKCVEGPYALRISDDGTIRPCLNRKDNIVFFTEKEYFNGRTKE